MFKEFFKTLPKSLIIIVLSGIFVWLLQPMHLSIDLVGHAPSGLPSFYIPKVPFSDLRRLLPTAITLALVQFMNVITLGKTFGFKHQYSVRANNELFALGSANILGGLFQSLPTSGSYSRSAINDQAGGQTPLTNMFAALLIIITLFLLMPLVYYIPMPALAAIIIVAALGLIDIAALKETFITKERDGYIALFTFVTTLFIGIQEGILLGIAASLIDTLIRNSRPNLAVLGRVKGDRIFRDIENFPTAQEIEGILVVRVDASFSFNNAEYMKHFILSKSDDKPVSYVVIDGQSINDIDTTAIDTLEMIVQDLRNSGIELYFAGLKMPVREILIRSGLPQKMGGQHFHLTPDKAVRYILEQERQEDANDERLKKYDEERG
jgi:SulP family sulfate permease